jgi:putative ABC transport system substrate-binding protein
VARQGGQALLISPDVLFYENRGEIMRVALKHGLPTTSSRSYLEAGALVSYTNALSEQENRVATYIDRILRGARPEHLPVEQPTKFELGINLKTAEALGIAVPQSLRTRADLVIE